MYGVNVALFSTCCFFTNDVTTSFTIRRGRLWKNKDTSSSLADFLSDDSSVPILHTKGHLPNSAYPVGLTHSSSLFLQPQSQGWGNLRYRHSDQPTTLVSLQYIEILIKITDIFLPKNLASICPSMVEQWVRTTETPFLHIK